MPQVPYSPVPTERPTNQGAPEFSVNTPAAAFGGNIAEAISGLGRVTEKAGDEIFQRAVALQQLANETEAKEADADYMVKAGELHAKYNTLQGPEAVRAYPKYAKDLQEERQKIRGSLSNDMARKMYDGNSLSTMGRSIFNGAGHAATENKKAAVGAATAQIDLDIKAVSDNPQDNRLFNDKIKRTTNNVDDLVGLQGLDEDSPQAKNLKQNYISKLWAERIIGLSHQKPSEAAKMLDENAKFLTEGDRIKTETTVRAQSRAVGSANIANSVYSSGVDATGDQTRSLKTLQDEARERAAKEFPNDPLMPDHAVKAVEGKYNRDKHARTFENNSNRDAVMSAIISGKPQTEQQLRADPKIAAAIDALPASQRKSIPTWINQYNASANKITNDENYLKLRGMATAFDDKSRSEFLETDLTSQQLSRPDLDRLLTVQQKMKETAFADPRVKRALGWIRSARGNELVALGIDALASNNKEDYYSYAGALSIALDVWQEDHKKPPSQKEVVEEIAPQVLRMRQEPGKLFGSIWPNKKPFFQQEVPTEWEDNWKTFITGKGQPEPTKEQIARDYLNFQYRKLYGKAKPSE